MIHHRDNEGTWWKLLCSASIMWRTSPVSITLYFFAFAVVKLGYKVCADHCHFSSYCHLQVSDIKKISLSHYAIRVICMHSFLWRFVNVSLSLGFLGIKMNCLIHFMIWAFTYIYWSPWIRGNGGYYNSKGWSHFKERN